jgi:hypothetical protein
MCIFTSFGYAQLSSTLRVSGDVDVKPPNAIFIVGITNVQTSGTTINTSPVNIGYPSAKMLSEIVFSGRNSSVTFDVLIMNGTEFDQYFDILEEYAELPGVEGSFSYANTDWSSSVAQGTKIASGEKMTFTVTLTYTGRYTNQTRRMLHEFDFVLDSNDLTEAVSEDVTNKFEDILNNRLEEDIVYTLNGTEITVDKDSTYQTVIENMESDRTGNYIGNLMGSDADDKAILTALFEGALTFTVGNEEVPITVMIKEKNVYGSDEKDMVLYITADDLSARNTYVPVYASVFTKNSSGKWEQVGEVFSGEAQTNSYSGFWGSGSFNTESWRSSQAYYGVATRSDIDEIMIGYKAQAQ